MHLPGFHLITIEPDEAVFLFRRGKLRRQLRPSRYGYLPWRESLMRVPLKAQELVLTQGAHIRDYQPLQLKGELRYRLQAPLRIVERFDFHIDGRKQYRGDGPARLRERVEAELCLAIQAEVGQRDLDACLRDQEVLGVAIAQRLQAAPPIRRFCLRVERFRLLERQPGRELLEARAAAKRTQLRQETEAARFALEAWRQRQEQQLRAQQLQAELEAAETESRILAQRLETTRLQHWQAQQLQNWTWEAHQLREKERRNRYKLDMIPLDPPARPGILYE